MLARRSALPQGALCGQRRPRARPSPLPHVVWLLPHPSRAAGARGHRPPGRAAAPGITVLDGHPRSQRPTQTSHRHTRHRQLARDDWSCSI